MTREVFEASGGRLKVVGRAGVGVDNVDLTAATEVLPLTAPGTRADASAPFACHRSSLVDGKTHAEV